MAPHRHSFRGSRAQSGVSCRPGAAGYRSRPWCFRLPRHLRMACPRSYPSGRRRFNSSASELPTCPRSPALWLPRNAERRQATRGRRRSESTWPCRHRCAVLIGTPRQVRAKALRIAELRGKILAIASRIQESQHSGEDDQSAYAELTPSKRSQRRGALRSWLR